MPSYELALVIRKLARPELVKTLKRTATNIYNHQGVLFGIENLGTRPLPYAISSFGKRYREGSFFLMRLEAPASSTGALADECERDIDILRAGLIREKTIKHVECSVEEDFKPPAYRADVKNMIAEGRKREKKFQLNIGFPYNPFNR